MKEGEARLIDVEGIPEFWDSIRAASHRCLVLDYDGTLAPFRVDRMEAYPLDGVIELLGTIRDETDTYLAIMTGRPLRELLALLGDLDVPVSASQGSEFMYPDGRRESLVPSDRQRLRLDRAEQEARERSPHGRVERKITGVALHTRGVEPELARKIEDEVCRAWEVDADEHRLDCRHFNGGIELRIKNIDKGTALSALLDGRPGDALCVYLGDDETDEDALLVLRDSGYGIKVGNRDVPTYARGRLGGPEDVREFLKSWIKVTRAQ